jgi:hypothetical protein
VGDASSSRTIATRRNPRALLTPALDGSLNPSYDSSAHRSKLALAASLAVYDVWKGRKGRKDRVRRVGRTSNVESRRSGGR